MADKESRTHHPTTSSPATPSIVSAYDWGALGHVVDVGGGDGTLMIALLNEYPALRGTVVDLPATAETARKMLDAAGLSRRANAVAGDFLSALPRGAEGAEGYVLSGVLHEWSDDDARAILSNCASAGGEDGAVFVIEPVAPGDDVSGAHGGGSGSGVDGVAVDTDASVSGSHAMETGSAPRAGNERDVAGLTALAESAGLVVAAVHTTGTSAIVELAAR